MNDTRRSLLTGLAALTVGLLGAATAAPALAQSGAAGAKPKIVTMRGTLACLGCDLKKAHGAGAQCSVYGHKHALKTSNGKYYTFLENARSEPLIKGEALHGKQVEVRGTVFPGSQVIEVTSYKQIGGARQTGQNTAAPAAAKLQTATLKVTGMT